MWSAIISTYNYSNRLVIYSNYGSQFLCNTYSLNKNLGPNGGVFYLEHISVYVQYIINTYIIDYTHFIIDLAQRGRHTLRQI